MICLEKDLLEALNSGDGCLPSLSSSSWSSEPVTQIQLSALAFANCAIAAPIAEPDTQGIYGSYNDSDLPWHLGIL
jgi:hypothetical protein